MNKFIYLVSSLLLLISFVSATVIPIFDCNGLQNMDSNLNANYVLVNDINCSGFDYGGGLGFKPIGGASTFKGNFDGNGFIISNLKINRPNEDMVGLFRYVNGICNKHSTIKNVGLVDANIRGRIGVGGITSTLSYAGIYNSYFIGEINGTGSLGGIAGTSSYGIITNSYSMGKVTRVSGTSLAFGGLVGLLSTQGNIYNSYSVAEVSTGGSGLVGVNNSVSSAVVSNSFYDTNVSGRSDVGKGTPKTTSEMKNVSIYLNKWNLVDQWGFVEGDYPKLRWQKDIDFNNAFLPDEKLKVDIAIVADTSGSMSSVWATLCTDVSTFLGNLQNSEYDYRLTLYGMGSAGHSPYCANVVTNSYFVNKYGIVLSSGGISQDWPSNGYMVVEDHDWRENASARIMFLVGDNDSVAQGSTAYTPRCERLVQSALEKNVIVNPLMRLWSINTIGASDIITTGTGGTSSLYGTANLLDLVEDIVSQQVQYYPEDLNDVGQCLRGIRRMLPDGNWEVVREPVYPSPEDNNYLACHDGIDNDCDGFTDSADSGCVFTINDVNFSPSVPMTMQDVNISFNVNNPNGGQVTCAIKENGVSQTLTGTNPEFNLNLGKFGSGSYLFGLFCSNGSLFEENVYPFDVFALPDLAIDAIMANSNPEVGEDLEITSEIRNNGGTNFSNVPIELVYTDMNGDTVDRVIQNISVGRNSSEVVVFHKIISTMGWKILEINIDPANVIEEEYEFNNTSGKLIYGGLFDPSNSSAKINIDSIVYPDVRPITGPGFLFVGKATYEIDGNNTNYPVAGAQIDITIDSNITTDASPFAELRDWTQSDGNFVIPFENPRVLADYNALIEITDGTAYGSSIENFIVDQNAGSMDYNTPWGDWNGPTSGGGGGWGGGGGGGGGGGWGGDGDGVVTDCNKANLTSSISVNYPNIDFSIGGNDAHGSEESIANKSYNIVITLNNTAISFSRTGVLNEVVYSGTINDSILPQTASIYVDSGNDINECYEYDNYAKVDLRGPNIKAKSIDAVSLNRKKLLQGEVTRFTLVMQNTGSTILNNVPVTFSIDGNIFRSYIINSIAPSQSNVYTFDDVLNSYGLTRFTLESSFVDSDMNDNRFSKLFKVLIPDYYVRSFEDGPLIIVNPFYPTVGQRVDINATVKSNDRISRDASVPVELFADGALVNASSVLFPNGKNFAFAQMGDYVAPMLEKTVSMGIYINRALRQYEENSMNNYVTFSLFVQSNPLVDVNVSLLKYVDLNSLIPLVDKVLNTKFSNESSVLDQIKTFINTSANLSADTNGVYRILVDVNNQKYYSNYFMVGTLNPSCGSVIVPDCEEGFEPVESVDENNCPIVVCQPVKVIIVDCWSDAISPHPICTLNDLNRIRTHLDWSYELKNDINASETKEWNDGAGFEPIGNHWATSPSFNGSFDGNNFVISGLYINRPEMAYVGLFGNSEGDLRRVKLINSEVIGGTYVGCLTGSEGYREISDCSVDCLVIGSDSVGGLAGNNNGIILNSYSDGFVFGRVAGGLVGINYYGTIKDSYSLADVNGYRGVGGLVGANHDSGGRAFVYDSYSVGRVYSFGMFAAPGGLIGGGDQDSIYIDGSYWDIESSGQATSSGGEGKTTSEMFEPSTFVDWDRNIWNIVQGEYPKLIWE